MKNLQNNFTTPEQSKRLLELGVPAYSADMYYATYKREGSEHEYLCNDGTPSVINIHRGLSVGNFRTQSNLIPSWSVGRLIEILETCWTDRLESPIWYNYPGKGRTIIERVLWDFENKRLDFSKLED